MNKNSTVETVQASATVPTASTSPQVYIIDMTMEPKNKSNVSSMIEVLDIYVNSQVPQVTYPQEISDSLIVEIDHSIEVIPDPDSIEEVPVIYVPFL